MIDHKLVGIGEAEKGKVENGKQVKQQTRVRHSSKS